MIECYRAIHPQSVRTDWYAGIIVQVYDVDGIDEGTGETISGSAHTGRTVYAAGLTGVHCPIHCVLSVGACVHAVGCSEGEVVVNTRIIVRFAGVALDGRWSETGQTGWIA